MEKPIGYCQTDGSGLWSHAVRVVKITGLDLAYLDEDSLIESTFGELRAYFDEDSWYADDGLIYTDESWMTDFRRMLRQMGFSERASEAVDYSEAGMQGRDYVSMDVGDPFIIECDKFMNFAHGNKPKKIEISVTAFD